MTQGMIIGDEGHILLHVQDGQPVGEIDPVVAGWFERGVPSLRGVDTDGVISEQNIVVPPDDPFFLLALMEEAERRDWTVVDEAGPEQKSDLLDVLSGRVQLADGHRFFRETELREAGRRIAAQPWATKIADQDYSVLRSDVVDVRQDGPMGVVVELRGDHSLHLEGMPASSFMLWWQAVNKSGTHDGAVEGWETRKGGQKLTADKNDVEYGGPVAKFNAVTEKRLNDEFSKQHGFVNGQRTVVASSGHAVIFTIKQVWPTFGIYDHDALPKPEWELHGRVGKSNLQVRAFQTDSKKNGPGWWINATHKWSGSGDMTSFERLAEHIADRAVANGLVSKSDWEEDKHPRSETGEFAPGNSGTARAVDLSTPEDIVFHGTSADYIDSILKEGLRPGLSNTRMFSDAYYRGDRGQAVYATARPDDAVGWANQAAHNRVHAEAEKVADPHDPKYNDKVGARFNELAHKARLVVFTVATSNLNFNKDAEAHEDAAAYYHIGTIPPEAIKSYSIYDYTGVDLLKHVELKSQSDIMHIPTVIFIGDTEPEEKSVGDKPGHDFHGNQWTQQNAQPDVPAGVLKYIDLLTDQTPRENSHRLMSVLDVLSEFTNQGFDDGDNDALADYCDDGFQEINQGLRSGNQPSFDAFHFTPFNLEKLDGLFEKIRPLGVPTTLYRSVDPDTVDRLKPGDVFEDKGFTSTSFRMKEALAFHDTPPRAIVMVQTSAKTKAVVVSETNEYEAILRRGSRFRVLSVDGEVDPDDYDTQAEQDLSPLAKPKRRLLKVEVLDD